MPDPALPAHKIKFNHQSSPHLMDMKHHGIMAETSFSPEKQIRHETVEDQIIKYVLSLGLLPDKGPVLFQKFDTIKYAYPIQTRETRGLVESQQSVLRKMGIHSIGRFGAWRYANSDDCMNMGFNLAQELNRGVRGAGHF